VSVEAVFRTVLAALQAVGIPYMVTGSFASSIHGEPRASQDIDIVIAPTREQLVDLVRRFPDDRYYADEEDALDSFAHGDMFNIIDYGSGWKVDFIFLKQRPFSQAEFARRKEEDLAGLRLTVATAEDILIAKLEWAKLGESQRQLEDAASIIRIKGDQLDTGYVDTWVNELGLEHQWSAARALAVF
jgi:hypothetical protein